MTRAKAALMFPPSPKKACVKLPELRAKVRSPRPIVWRLTVMPAHAESTTLDPATRPRSSTIRRVSDPVVNVAVAISQNRWLNSWAGFDVLTSFSMRSVARLEKGWSLLTVGAVEYSAYTESLAHTAVPLVG